MSSDPANSGNRPSPYPAYIQASARLDQAIKRIAEAIRDYRAEFLFGAGMSKSSGIPPGRALAERLLAEHFFPGAGTRRPSSQRLEKIATDFPLEAVAEAIGTVPGTGRADLTKKVRKALFEGFTPELSAHDLFLSICYWDDKPRLSRVFTTNFDALLKDAFGQKGFAVTRDNYSELRDLRRQRIPRIPIIHLHGKLEGKYQITEADVFDTSYNPIAAQFRAALEEAEAFVLVGYSMSDPDFRGLYMRFREEIRARDPGAAVERKTTYVVSPPDDEFDYQVGAEVWNSRGAIWIPLDAKTFFETLRTFLQYETGSEALSELAARFGTRDEKAFTERVDRIAELMLVNRGNAIQFLNETLTRSGGRP